MNDLNASQLAKRLNSFLNQNNIFPSSLKLKNLTTNALTDENLLHIEIMDTHNQMKNLKIDTNKLDADSLLSIKLVKNWLNKDLYEPFLSRDTSELDEINEVIESLINEIDDEISKKIIKDDLHDLAKDFKEDKLELNKELIYKKFTQATVSIMKNNMIDRLTGVYNQNFYHNILTGLRDNESIKSFNSIQSLKTKTHGDLGVAFLDINNFKGANDKFGHDIGDNVLRELSNKTKEIVGNDAIITRRGGDEFIVIAPIHSLKNLTIDLLNKSNTEQLSNDCGVDTSILTTSTSIGVKKIDTESITQENCSKILKDTIKDAETISEQAKTLAHYEFGASRGDPVPIEEYIETHDKFAKNLKTELDINKIDIFDNYTDIRYTNNELEVNCSLKTNHEIKKFNQLLREDDNLTINHEPLKQV